MEERIGLLFDVDGVLVDSLHHTYRAITFVCDKVGVTPPTFEMMQCTMGAPYHEFWHSIGVRAPQEEVSLWYHQAANHRESELFPDAREALEHLGNHCSMPLGIVTANYEGVVEEIFARGGIAPDLIQYRACDQQEKVAALREFRRIYELSPIEAFFVGDLHSDMRDGRIAGVRCIGMTRGGSHASVLRAAGAEHCVTDFAELLDYLKTGRYSPQYPRPL